MKDYKHIWVKNRCLIYFVLFGYILMQLLGSPMQNTNHLTVSATDCIGEYGFKVSDTDNTNVNVSAQFYTNGFPIKTIVLNSSTIISCIVDRSPASRYDKLNLYVYELVEPNKPEKGMILQKFSEIGTRIGSYEDFDLLKIADNSFVIIVDNYNPTTGYGTIKIKEFTYHNGFLSTGLGWTNTLSDSLSFDYKYRDKSCFTFTYNSPYFLFAYTRRSMLSGQTDLYFRSYNVNSIWHTFSLKGDVYLTMSNIIRNIKVVNMGYEENWLGVISLGYIDGNDYCYTGFIGIEFATPDIDRDKRISYNKSNIFDMCKLGEYEYVIVSQNISTFNYEILKFSFKYGTNYPTLDLYYNTKIDDYGSGVICNLTDNIFGFLFKNNSNKYNKTLYVYSIDCNKIFVNDVYVYDKINQSTGVYGYDNVYLTKYNDNYLIGGYYNSSYFTIISYLVTYSLDFINISDNDIIDFLTMGTLTVDYDQFVLILLLSIWIFLVSEYTKIRKEKDSFAFASGQFIVAIPLIIYISALSYINSIIFGYLVSVALGIVSTLLLAYAYLK